MSTPQGGPTADVSVRVAWADDAEAIAQVQVKAWRRAYEHFGVLPTYTWPDAAQLAQPPPRGRVVRGHVARRPEGPAPERVQHAMAKTCEICGKVPVVGRKISHAHNVSARRFEPNLQRVKALVNGAVRRIRVCTRCIRSNKVVKAA